MKTSSVRKLFSALVLGCLIVTASPICVFAQEPYTGIVGTTHLFIITPPTGWTVTEMPPNEVRFQLKVDSTGLQVGLQVLGAVQQPGKILSMAEIISELKRTLPSSIPNFKITQERDVKIGGIDAHELLFTGRAGEVTAMSKLLVILRGERVYAITYLSPEGTYNRYLADADRSIDSFRFTEKLTFDTEPRTFTITVDQKTYSPKELPKAIFLTSGSTHTIAVESTVPKAAGTRYAFLEWSDGNKEPSRTITITKSENCTAKYKTQYELTVESEYGNPEGEGWYDAGAKTTFSVTSPVPESGLFGTLGRKNVFEKWTGDSTASSASATITMDGPKSVTAQWRTDDSMLYIIVGGIGAVLVIIIVALAASTRRRKVTVAAPLPPPTLPPPPPPVARPPPPTEVLPSENRFCMNCGVLLPGPVKYCHKCGAEQ